jgi:hypothetical protein
MSGPGPLEDGYRRLLALYPAEHRRAHEAEMLGVLMTGARAGQRHPGVSESADLIWGALRIGLRPGSHGSPDPRWRDALAAVSVVLPLLALLYFTTHDLLGLAWLRPGNALLAGTVQWDLQTLAWWLALATLVLLRLRRTAALAAAAMLTWYTVSSAGGALNWGYLDPQWMLIFFALGLEIAALVTSPGPRRGLQILTRKHYALAAVVAVTLGAALGWLWPSHQAASDAIMITVIAASMGGMAAASPLSRRVMVLLSALAYYFIVGLIVPPSMVGGPFEYTSGWVGPLRVTLTCLPLAAAVVCLAIMALRSAHQTSPGDGRVASIP